MGRFSDWMKTPVQVEDDTFDRESVEQDVTDPVWPSAPLEPDVSLMRPTDPDSGEVRTLTGVLDFVVDLAEDILTIDDAKTQREGRKRNAPVVDTWTRAATSWRSNTFNVGVAEGGVKIVTERDDRTRVIVTNHGPGVLYLSNRTGAEQGPNTIRLLDPAVTPALASREFRTADEIWAYPATPGTPQIVDVQDEYGCPE